MTMNYGTLTASKGSSGAIATWIGYSKLDVGTLLDEAQSLIYSILRCREMRTEWVYGAAVGQCNVALPLRFLDPIGRLYNVTDGIWLGHKLEGTIQEIRTYDNSVVGVCPTSPFTTTAGLSTVTVNDPAHGLNQGSTVTFAGATTVDVFTLNGTYPVTAIIDANDFTIDTVDTLAVTSATGGGSSVTYTANNLTAAPPTRWSIWNEEVQFDTAHDVPKAYKQLYYRAPQLLSATNTTNFLTVRYPKLIRVATQAAAADFMKDDTEYQKGLAALTALVQSIAVEQDMLYRGADITLDVPGMYYND
jgi:hypothetical protein